MESNHLQSFGNRANPYILVLWYQHNWRSMMMLSRGCQTSISPRFTSSGLLNMVWIVLMGFDHRNSFQSFGDSANPYPPKHGDIKVEKKRLIMPSLKREWCFKGCFSICQCGLWTHWWRLRRAVSRLGQTPPLPPFSPFNLSLQWGGGA